MRTVAECIAYVEAHMEIRYATKNGAYKAGRRINNPDGSVNHSVGCAQPSAEVFFKLMNDADAGWGVNALLGDFHKGDGRILVTMPLNARPWGCGKGKKGSWNNTHIQWEICEPAGHTYSGGTMIGYNVEKNQGYFERMWRLLVAWNVYVIHKLGYPVSGIADHRESYLAGYGSNHGDVSHWFPKHGKTMDDLRKEVEAILNYVEPEEPAPAEPTTPQEECDMTEAQIKQLFSDMLAEHLAGLQNNDSGQYSAEARKWATENKLFVGNGTMIEGEPNMMWQSPVTREHLSIVLHRFAQLMGMA